MSEQGMNGNELLIRVDERVESLTRSWQDFTVAYARESESTKQEIECERRERTDADEKIQKDVDWLKSKFYMGAGALLLVQFALLAYNAAPK